MRGLVINDVCGTQVGYYVDDRIRVADRFNVKVFDFGQRISYVKGGLWKFDRE